MSPRKAQVLALYLPLGAATWMEAGTDTAWSVSDYLLAEIVDSVHWIIWQLGGRKSQKPKPIDRPAQMREAREKRERVLAKAAEFKRRHSNN